jgi:hypothetical protein
MGLLWSQVVETALAGNGGAASSGANGGAVSAGDVNSGGNMGTAIGVGDSVGDVMVSGGSGSNLTNLNVGANAGMAHADAAGGDYNVAFVS